MTLGFYMDHHVHSGIVNGLRARGIDCITAQEDRHAAADDAVILQRASDLSHIVFSQDVDFLEIASRWVADGRPFAGLVYARQMGITIGQAINDLELIARTLDIADMRNTVEWIPL